VSSFDLRNCAVTVVDAYGKNRRQSVLALRSDTAEKIQGLLAGKMPNVQAFKVPDKTAKMIQADLADAGIPYKDSSGRYFDFHALRHETGTLLAAAQVHPKVAQSIMRHSDINLTMGIYTHTLTGQESKAVAKLPDLSLTGNRQKSIATGTDDKVFGAGQDQLKKLTPKLTPTTYSGCNQSATNVNSPLVRAERTKNHKPLHVGKLDNKSSKFSSNATTEKETRPAGLEPATFGFEVRNSCL